MRVAAAILWVLYAILLVEVFRRLSQVTAQDEIACARLMAMRSRCLN